MVFGRLSKPILSRWWVSNPKMTPIASLATTSDSKKSLPLPRKRPGFAQAPSPPQPIYPISDGVGPTPQLEWSPASKRTGLVGLKLGMSCLWDEWGVWTPVTIVQVSHSLNHPFDMDFKSMFE